MFNVNQETIWRKFDILRTGVKDILTKLAEDEDDPKSPKAEVKRAQARKNFSKKDDEIPFDYAKESSLKNSQGTSSFSGTSYNGPGKVRHETTDTNKLQKNFQNHQGNK